MEFNFVVWDNDYNGIILLNFAIIILIFSLLRKFSGVIEHIDASNELLAKHNAAFGISLAGVTLAIAIILKGAIYGELANNIVDSSIAVGLYSVIGIGLMILTRIIFDDIALPHIAIRKQISEGNISAAVIDAGNMVATAIIVSTVMSWITNNSIEKILILCAGYLISQIVLTAITYIHIKNFSRKNHKSIEAIFESGNIALALRFAGRKIGTAYAITAASHVISYELDYLSILFINWFIISIVMVSIYAILTKITDFCVLYKVDTNKEVIERNNIAVGALQGIIFISLGLLMSELVL